MARFLFPSPQGHCWWRARPTAAAPGCVMTRSLMKRSNRFWCFPMAQTSSLFVVRHRKHRRPLCTNPAATAEQGTHHAPGICTPRFKHDHETQRDILQSYEKTHRLLRAKWPTAKGTKSSVKPSHRGCDPSLSGSGPAAHSALSTQGRGGATECKAADSVDPATTHHCFLAWIWCQASESQNPASRAPVSATSLF